MTSSISTFLVQVAFNQVVYDVEITPLMHGRPFPISEERLHQWKEAEREYRLFSTQISQMLKQDGVPEGKMITLGSSEGFTSEGGLVTQHKTSNHWAEFIQSLQDPVSRTARLSRVAVPEEEPVLDTRSSSAQELIQSTLEPASRTPRLSRAEDDSVRGFGIGLTFNSNPYGSLSSERQKQVEYSVFRKLCEAFYRAEMNIPREQPILYDETELACLEIVDQTLSTINPANEANALWRAQDAADRDRWSLDCQRIKDQIAEEAKAAELRQADIAAEAARAALSTPPIELSDPDEL